ncbi:tetratricopeptide repeat protein [Anatilimnocola aggregata]|uniref:tetratricopeptide repeat protein n=1 Tax=Anatilimnocola aggregata TaxID=2528021 RepID=UPI001EE41128|nr:tetratricopeptide repeat protein [Anatilimnocola aggregata]
MSLAINYALHGLDVEGYHATNLALHLLNAILIWRILFEAFRSRFLPERIRSFAEQIAYSVALVWVVHPLLTIAVTYVIQRAEVLMATFYLSAIYCFLRGSRADNPRPWYLATAFLCAVGQGAKEVMATAPLAILLIDVALIAGSWRDAFRARRFWHALNFLSLSITFILIARQGGRSGTVGAENLGDRLAYLALQSEIIIRYLQLCVWPSPLVFDYGTYIPPLSASQLPAFITVSVLAVLFVVLYWKKPVVGLLGVLFFVILAPTSSFVPVITQVAAEHRMYLPLALVLTGGMVAIVAFLPRLRPDQSGIGEPNKRGLTAITVVLAICLGTFTLFRNGYFRNEFTLWQDTALKAPTNLRACRWYATGLLALGQKEAAMHVFDVAINSPRAAEAYCGRADIYLNSGDTEQAAEDVEAALKIDPKCHQALNMLGAMALNRGDNETALKYFTQAIQVSPQNETYLRNRGNALVVLNELHEARSNYDAAIAISPGDPESHFVLAMLDFKEGHLTAAAAGLRRTLYYDAAHPEALQWLPEVEKQIRTGVATKLAPIR